MKIMLIILLCLFPLIGNGQEENKNHYDCDVQIKPYVERLLLMQQLVENFENVLEIKDQQLATAKIIIDIKDSIIEVLVKKCKDYERQDSIKFQIKTVFPMLILEDNYIKDSLKINKL